MSFIYLVSYFYFINKKFVRKQQQLYNYCRQITRKRMRERKRERERVVYKRGKETKTKRAFIYILYSIYNAFSQIFRINYLNRDFLC